MRGSGALAGAVKPFLTGMFDKALQAVGKTKEYAQSIGATLPADFKPSALIEKGFDIEKMKKAAYDAFYAPYGVTGPVLVDLKAGIKDAFTDYGFGYKKRKGKKMHRKRKS